MALLVLRGVYYAVLAVPRAAWHLHQVQHTATLRSAGVPACLLRKTQEGQNGPSSEGGNMSGEGGGEEVRSKTFHIRRICNSSPLALGESMF